MLDDQAVLADDDVCGIVHELRRRQYRDVDDDVVNLIRLDGIETRVVMRDIASQSDNGLGQRLACIQCSEAPAQIVTMVGSHEDTEGADLQIGWYLRRRRAVDARDEGVTREEEESLAIGRANHRHTAAAM